MGSDRDRHRRVHACQLLDRDRVGEVVRSAAAVLLGIGDSHQPEPAELLHDLVREALLAVELLGDRPHLLLGEVANEAPDVLLLGAELEVHSARDRIHCSPVDRTSLLWTIVLFFGASIMFALIRRATEDSSTAVTIGAQVAALALLIGAIVILVRRSQR